MNRPYPILDPVLDEQVRIATNPTAASLGLGRADVQKVDAEAVDHGAALPND